MLNQIDLSRADLNLLVLFELVLEERHVGRAAERLQPVAVGGQPRPRPAAPASQRSAVPAHAQGRGSDRARDRAGRTDRRHPRAGQSASSRPPSHSTPRRPCAASPSARPTASRPCSCPRCSPCAPRGARHRHQRAAAPASAWRCRPSAPGSLHSTISKRARSISRSFPLDEIPARFARADPLRGRVRHRDARRVIRSHKPRRWNASADAAPARLAHRRCPRLRRRGLAEHGLSRRVALTVPNFMMALAIIADTDLIAALPGSSSRCMQSALA